MKRVSICLLLLLLLMGAAGDPAAAQLSVLSEAQMAGVTGGFGVNIPAGQTVGLTLAMDRLYYYDADGTGDSSRGRYLSLCGIHLKGSITVGAAGTATFADFSSLFEGAGAAGIDMAIDDATIRIDRFDIDAIRIGDAPGAGPSFGAIGMRNLLLQVSGRIQIYAH